MSLTSFNRRIVAVLVVSCTTFVAASASLAQAPEDYSNVPPGPFHQPVPTYPVEMGFSQDHSSTAYEGAQRGDAAVIQALGNYELSTSQASILGEQARWLNRENDLKQTAALYAQQKMWEDNRIENRQARAARIAAGQVIQTTRRATVYREAYQLLPTELNAATGEIGWPTALKMARYQECRERLDELFREHTGYGAPSSATAKEIARTVDQLTRTLRDDIAMIPRGDYLACQKFLKGLKYEAAGMVEG